MSPVFFFFFFFFFSKPPVLKDITNVRNKNIHNRLKHNIVSVDADYLVFQPFGPRQYSTST